MKIFVTPDLSEKSKLGKPKSGCNFLNRNLRSWNLQDFLGFTSTRLGWNLSKIWVVQFSPLKMKIFVTPDLSEKSKLGKPKSGCNFLNRKSQELKLAGFPRVHKYSVWIKFEQNLRGSFFTPKNENICDPGPVGKNQLGKPKSGCNFLNRKSQELKLAGFPLVYKYSVFGSNLSKI